MKLNKFESAVDSIHFKNVFTWAKEEHSKAGCNYSGYAYDLHIDAVVNVGWQYLHLIEADAWVDTMCANSCHDLLEDTNVNYSDLVKNTSVRCADIVYNVTNELGKNRKERAEKTYPKIASCKYSTFVKLCDRIGNLKFSYFCNDEKGMFKKYQQEYPEFFKALHNSEHGFDDMWKEIQVLTSI